MCYQVGRRVVVSGLVLLYSIAWLASPLAAADCNGNGHVDSEEIAAGENEDCNDSGIPDECENVALEIGAIRNIAAIENDAPRVLLSGDLDGDGDLDLVLGAGRGRERFSVRVFRNDGGAFGLIQTREQPLFALLAAELSDADNDGDPDLIATGNTALFIFLNDGNGTLGAPEIHHVTEELFDSAVTDFDGDSLPDVVVVSDVQHSAFVLLNRDGGTFETSAKIPLGENSRDVVAGDLNADGLMDFASMKVGSRDISLVFGTGGGRFAAPRTVDLGGERGREFGATDLNGDGVADLAVRVARKVLVFYGQDGGLSVSPAALHLIGSGLTFADVDSDRDDDLILLRENDILMRINDGRETLPLMLTSLLETSVTDVTAGDFDGDGDQDFVALATRDGVGRALVLIPNGLEHITTPTITEIDLFGCDGRGCLPHSGNIVDLDNDGDLDVIGATTQPGTLVVALNQGNGDLVPLPAKSFRNGSPQSVAVGDFDGDGLVDAGTVGLHSDRFAFHRGLGDGIFAPVVRYAVGRSPINVQSADFDRDGHLDVVAVNHFDSSVTVLMNQGEAIFTRPFPDFKVGLSPTAATAVDLDGDGFHDIATANSASRTISVLFNTGDGSMTRRFEVNTGSQPNHVGGADLDRDGDIDLFTSNLTARTASVLLNRGNGMFEGFREFSTEAGGYSIVAADFDTDGIVDLITANEGSSSVSILVGDGNGNFAFESAYDVGAGLRFVLPGDLDGDTDVDLVTTNRIGQSFSVVINRSRLDVPDFVESICTVGDFFAISDRVTSSPEVERFLKFLSPVDDDPTLLPTVFQNSWRYELHQDFLAEVYPERFPGLDSEQFNRLVGERATRRYFVGTVSRLRSEDGPLYGFRVFARFADGTERLAAAEVREIYERLRSNFRLEPLMYAPFERPAVEAARAWLDPGFPIYLGDQSSAGRAYEAYTRGVGYGRVRVFDREGFDAANARGLLTFRDVVVLDHAPRDIEGVVGGVITEDPQGQLSHVAVRTARRGTPNAFVQNAIESVFGELEGKIVRLEVRTSTFTVEEATLDDAEAWWEASRVTISDTPMIDEEHEALTSLSEIALMDPVVADPLEARFGGKASNLGRLQSILEGDFESYRERGFVIPMRYYLEFLRSNFTVSLKDGQPVTLEQYIDELLDDALFQSDSEARFVLLDDLRERMRGKGRVSEELVSRLTARMEEVFGSLAVMVRFRSSSNVEDALEFNGAGLYDSTGSCAADTIDQDTVGPSRCDPSRETERPVERAVKKVWASLWNFRAFEEREYYGIPQQSAAMAILVSRAFLDEAANGVAVTGNPSNPLDRRYLVTSQVGEFSVVSPEPGVIAARDVLEMADGEVARIFRTTPSSLLPAGVHVLDDDDLRALGRVLSHIDRDFPIDTGSYARDEVFLDIEFKKERDGSLAVKQVRPFLPGDSGEPPPTFELVIPEGTEVCGAFRFEREPRTEYELKSTVRFRAGTTPLPVGNEVFAADIVEALRFGPDQSLAMPVGEGVFRREIDQDFDDRTSETTYRFRFEQNFSLPDDGGEISIELALPDFVTVDGESVDSSLTIDEQLIREDRFRGVVELAGADLTDLRFSSCEYADLPLWEINAQFADGTSLVLEERFQPVEIGDAGPAALVHAELVIGGSEREESSYWNLVYAALKHNQQVRHWVVLDPPAIVAGIEEMVHVVELVNRDDIGSDPVIEHGRYLGESLQILGEVNVTRFERRLTADNEKRTRFRRGDVNASGKIDNSDILHLLQYLFSIGAPPECRRAADADDDGRLNITDPIRILLHLFRGSGALPRPFDACGLDRSSDDLDCGTFAACP